MKLLIVVLGLATAVFGRPSSFEDPRRLALQNPNLYDGDMMGVKFDENRNAIVGDYLRWTGAKVPYVIDGSLAEHTNLIKQAFALYEKHTCVEFVPRTNEDNYIEIFSGKGCYSYVGMVGGKQRLSLGGGCVVLGTIVHEIGHALGFYHEQSRSDRDDYLDILLQNVIKGHEVNFQKLGPNENILYNSFDYGSIMIYGNDAFSKDGSDTMRAKNGQKLYHPFHKDDMTKKDIERVNKMYNCQTIT